jgi:hypothetical protein
MPKSEIEEFAKLLMTEVRDKSIASCDGDLKPDAKGPVAKRWHSLLDSSTGAKLAETIITDCVDETLFQLLQAVDSGVLQLSFRASNGIVVNLNAEGMGELSGWYMGGEWRTKYSQERVVDDFEDLV